MPKRATALMGAALAMILGATVVLASHQFPDVPDSHIFHDDIDWLADNGITTGYPNGNFGPEDNVTRGQMAAFMHRFSGTIGADTVVTSLVPPFEATNASVSLTPDGVEFGPYADGGAAGGSVYYSGLNGQPLSVVESLAFYIRYVSAADTGGVGVPYLRIFTDTGVENSAIFSAITQAPDPDVAEGPFHEWVATSGSWRYNDDPGNGPDMSFAALIAAHGTEEISGIYITTGFTVGTDLAALLRWVEINGEKFVFRD